MLSLFAMGARLPTPINRNTFPGTIHRKLTTMFQNNRWDDENICTDHWLPKSDELLLEKLGECPAEFEI